MHRRPPHDRRLRAIEQGGKWEYKVKLSEQSVKNRGKSMDIPDFTRGKWKTMPPLGIVS